MGYDRFHRKPKYQLSPEAVLAYIVLPTFFWCSVWSVVSYLLSTR